MDRIDSGVEVGIEVVPEDIYGVDERRSAESMLFDTDNWDEIHGESVIPDLILYREKVNFAKNGAAVVVNRRRLHALHDVENIIETSGVEVDRKMVKLITVQIEIENLKSNIGTATLGLLNMDAEPASGDVSVTDPETIKAGTRMLIDEMDENAKGGNRGPKGGILTF